MNKIYAFDKDEGSKFGTDYGDVAQAYVPTLNANYNVNEFFVGETSMLGVIAVFPFSDWCFVMSEPNNDIEGETPFFNFDASCEVHVDDTYDDDLFDGVSGDVEWFLKHYGNVVDMSRHGHDAAIDLLANMLSNDNVESCMPTREFSYSTDGDEIELLFFRDNPENRFELNGIYLTGALVDGKFKELSRKYYHKAHDPKVIHCNTGIMD